MGVGCFGGCECMFYLFLCVNCGVWIGDGCSGGCGDVVVLGLVLGGGCLGVGGCFCVVC